VLLHFNFNANTIVLLIYDYIIHIYIVVYNIGQLMLRNTREKRIYIIENMCLYVWLLHYTAIIYMLSKAVEFD